PQSSPRRGSASGSPSERWRLVTASLPATQVVAEGPAQVLADGAVGRLGKGQGPRHAGQLRGEEHDVGGFHRYVSARADGDAKVCLGQGRGVVDAVADHGDEVARLLEAGHLADL